LRSVTVGVLDACPLSYEISGNPPIFTLFPYTTLFRSRKRSGIRDARSIARSWRRFRLAVRPICRRHGDIAAPKQSMIEELSNPRSEEHTSELQSRRDLVCRLLLEKKKGVLR